MIPVFQDLTFLLFSIRKRDVVFPIPESYIPYLELTYCFEGELQYYYNDELLVLHAGDAILLPPGSLRKRLETHVTSLYASFNVQFPNDATFPASGIIHNAIRSNTLQQLETFQKDYSDISGYSKEKCTLIFSYLMYQLMETALDTENPHVRAIKQFVTDNFYEDISLQTIASAVHLAPQYCCTIFKKHTGMSIVQYILHHRIEYAKKLIITKDYPLSRIAENAGFQDYYYFCRVFKKHTGMSAKTYQKQSRMKIG